jgi:hypothetical protein
MHQQPAAPPPPDHSNRGHDLGRLVLELRTLDGWPEVNVNAWYLASDFLTALRLPAATIADLLGSPPARHTDTISPTRAIDAS